MADELMRSHPGNELLYQVRQPNLGFNHRTFADTVLATAIVATWLRHLRNRSLRIMLAASASRWRTFFARRYFLATGKTAHWTRQKIDDQQQDENRTFHIFQRTSNGSTPQDVLRCVPPRSDIRMFPPGHSPVRSTLSPIPTPQPTNSVQRQGDSRRCQTRVSGSG